MSTRYPGQRAHGRRGAAVAIAIVAALAAGFGLGRTVFHDDPTRTVANPVPFCPGGHTDPSERARAAGCLLEAYLALTNESAGVRDRRLADIVLPSQLTAQRKAYRVETSAPVNPPGKPARYAKIIAQYASVAAVKPGTQLRPGAYEKPDVGFTAWLAIAVATDDGSSPGANWYLGHFSIRWQSGRWWLTDAFHADQHASPVTYGGPQAATAFGSGWVAV